MKRDNYPDASTRYAADQWALSVGEVVSRLASNYLYWIAGHGADMPTVCAHASDIAVFQSHFTEWTRDLYIGEIIEALPAISHVLHYAGRSSLIRGNREKATAKAKDPPPPVVSRVLLFALQFTLLDLNQAIRWDDRANEFGTFYKSLVDNYSGLAKEDA